ncbi:Germinal-center associated nuclear protein [Armadillidium vulgare]|nr:Germinal-center associated nuclear protein [Armadillidium vulgare]
MDKSNENPNPFLPLDKGSKFQDSKIFGGNSVQFQGGASNPVTLVTKPSHTQNVFGNPSVFGSFPSSSSSFGQISKDSGKSQNLFGKTTTTTSIQTGSVFGSTNAKASNNTVLNPLTQNTTFSSNSNSFVSKAGNESSNTKVFGSNSQQSNPESVQPPQSSAIFSLQSRENKDSKDNIFGGNVDPSRPHFKPFEGVKESKFKVGEFSSSNETTKNQNPSFSVFGKPVKVFANVKTTKEPPQKSYAFESLVKDSSSDKQGSKFQKTSTSDTVASSTKQFVEHKDTQNKTVQSSVLIACNIPNDYVDSSVLKNHFLKFGPVQKVTINSKTNQAAIYFTDSKSAQEAKVKGKRLHPLLEEMKLFFGSQTQPAKPSERQITLKAVKESPKMPSRSSPYNKKLDVLVKTSKNPRALERNRSPNLTSKSEAKNKVPSGNLVSLKDFSVIVKTQAKNNYDKFLILDARDKNIRAKQEKIVDVNKARYLTASCPDMCPEKERYSRDIQYDISEYETTHNEMNHKLTVKKFSRSSADKDEPLPHELRPGPVLKMTMDFLLCNIVEKGDEPNVQIDLWYNYLCNRTRGLRSDIMQQHLVDDNAVYVLERCIRFHIHCSHALCEESPEYFDAKINNEHLSKSLQSLKELYHDLEDKGHSFVNEAEFRSYEILLSINDGNVIFKYLKFKEAIRNSSEVQLAIKVLHSIHTGNFANFFKLLKRATYLQSCIMHKYFANIRQRALNVIIKAYSTQSSPPADSIKSMLGFSNEDELLKYIEHYGIHINELTSVQNKSKSSVTPTTTPPVSKSAEIAMKKVQSVGEVINNGPLPENPLTYYKPHNSFSSDGYLRKKAIDASDQSRVIAGTKKSDDVRSVENITIIIDKPETENEDKASDLNLIIKSQEKYELTLLNRYFNNWKRFTVYQRKIKDIKEKRKMSIAKKMFVMWKNKAHELVISKRIAKKLLMQRYFRKWREYIHWRHEVKETIAIVKKNEVKILSRKYFTLWQFRVNTLKAEKEEKHARDYILKFRYFHKWLRITRESIAIKKSDELYQCRLLRSYFLRWKSWFVGRKSRNKVNIELFPAVGSLLSEETQNNMFDWGYDRDDDSYISTEEIAKLDEEIFIKNLKHYSVDKLSSIMSWMPLPLIQNCQRDILAKPPDLSDNLFHTYFKILLLIDYTHIDEYLLKWVRTKFNILEYEDLSKPLQCESHFTSPQNGMKYSILLCEKKLPQEVNKMDCCSLVILVGNESKLELLKKFSETLGQLPFLILTQSSFKNDLSHSIWSMTRETIDDPYTSEKLFNFVFSQWSLMKDRFKFHIGSCLKVVTNFIFHKVVSCITHELCQRQLYGNPNLHPATIVSFYNAGISHIISNFEKTKSQICNGLLLEKFSHNFLHSSMGNNKEFDKVLSSLRNACLPKFNVEFYKSESEIESNLVKYVNEVCSSSSWKGNLYSEVKHIIKETKAKFLEDQLYCSDSLKLDKFWYYIPWVEIFNSIILFKTSTLPDVNVVYKPKDLDEFDHSKCWTSEVKLSELVVPDLKEREPSVKRKAFVALPKKDPKKIKTDSVLLQNIEEEKRKFFEFERKLQSLLSIDEDDVVNNFVVENDS